MLLARTDPDRSQDPPRALDVRRREGRGARPRSFALRAGRRRRNARGPGHRHARVPRHALLRGVVRRLVRARREPRRRAKAGSARASTSRWRASRTAGCRPRRAPSASCRPRSRPALDYAQRAQGVRQAGRRLPADAGEAGAHGRAHPGRPPVLVRRGAAAWAAGEGTLEASMVKAYVCRAGRVGDARGDADPRRHGLRRGVPGVAATSSTPGCSRSSKAPTRRWPARSSPAASPSRHSKPRSSGAAASGRRARRG